MTIKNLTNEIFEKSFNRDSLERLLTKETKRKVEFALRFPILKPTGDVIQETLKSD